MPTQPERIAILETKVDNLKEGVDGLKDTLNETHQQMMTQLNRVQEENTREHAKVMAQLDDLMQFKNKWVWVGGVSLTVLSLVFGHLESIIKLFTH